MINKSVRFPNLSNFDRTEVAYTTVPFAKGEWDGESPLVLTNLAEEQIDSTIEPFGARWSDGTVRYARLLARLELAAETTAVHYLVDGQLQNEEPFAYSPRVIAGAGADGMTLGIKVDGDWEWNQFNTNLIVLEDGRLRKVFQSRSRMGNFVADMKFYISSRQQLVKFELAITGSNPDNELYVYPFEDIRLLVGGKSLFNIRGAARRGVEPVEPHRDYHLMRNNSFGDGQKQVWYGEIMPDIDVHDMEQISNGLAALNFPLYGMSRDWNATKAYGALASIQEATSPHGWEVVDNNYHNFNQYMNETGNYWSTYLLGLAKTAGQTGAQRDFGCIEGAEVIDLAAAELLDAYLFMATAQTKRPGHYYESDASPVRHVNHPQWVTWDGRTHWHTGVSSDRLGKNAPQMGNPHHGWFGKDWQHHSSNLLSMAALMTGSYMLKDEADTEMELYYAGFTLPSQYHGWSTSGIRAPRGFGRTHHAMCNHYLLTGREEIKDHMLDRFREAVMAQWDGATAAVVKNWSHVLDPRVLNGLHTGWVPWNETLGFVGIVALYNVTQDEDVKDLMVEWGNTIVQYGWRATRSGSTLVNAQLGGGVRWFPGGEALTPAQYLNPEFFQHAGGGLQLWGTPAIKVIAGHPSMFGQAESSLAQEYLSFQRGNYTPSPNNPYSEYGRWEALDLIEG
tara:strand:+ start:79 stop:2112 length:2034 start_codon:yes stop_codon:yes gene_type:complete